MDINVGPEYEAFRAEVRDFLSTRGHEAPESGDLDYKSERRLAWQKALIENGYAARTIPREYGGYGAEPDLLKSHIIAEEFARSPAPGSIVGQGISMLVPTLLELGTEAQKQRFY